MDLGARSQMYTESIIELLVHWCRRQAVQFQRGRLFVGTFGSGFTLVAESLISLHGTSNAFLRQKERDNDTSNFPTISSVSAGFAPYYQPPSSFRTSCDRRKGRSRCNIHKLVAAFDRTITHKADFLRGSTE
jgi:hypothetical protein